ncbi:MAG: TraI domain-containing protein [Halorhodospira halophila]|uniref:MobH family relaxase n=1 Tax=Halorhodospira TaxID=85108 RepID=UPI001EE7F1E5|nr:MULTISPECIES: MobH family relaxase [Halorhodospira]MCC3750832.1 TraI domain-containing protein [Halorhodospira halophila]MCG5537326.1 TraI domain-containing protein [Halorhodospira sp. 9622]
MLGLFSQLRSRAKEDPKEPPRPGLLPVCSAGRLLRAPERVKRVRKIVQLTAFPVTHRVELVDSLLRSFAGLVQELPASETHHHAGRGGLLDHGLETAIYSLQRRQGHVLPPRAEPERVVHEADAWTYALLALALVHDLGKVVVDQRITLYGSGGQKLRLWEPWYGTMSDMGAVWYAVRYASGRVHRLHEPASALLAHRVIPASGLAWIARHPDLFSLWAAALQGRLEDAGILGQLLQQGDRESVARSLGGELPEPLAAVKEPLGERLLKTLRYLFREKGMPLNRNGAAGWLKGEDLWLVSKRVADALREQLHEEGFHSLPSRNERLFDVLQEQGVVVPSGDRAIWKAWVTGDGWRHELTLLRVEASRIWPEPEQRPSEFEGSVEPVTEEQGTGSPVEPAPGGEEPGVTAEEEGQSADKLDSVGDDRSAQVGERAESAAALPDDADPGDAFWLWLTHRLGRGELAVNQRDARLHVVELEDGSHGLLLVSPGIFQDYGREQGQEWQRVQRRFLKKQLHRKAPDGTNIHRYVAKGQRRASELKGVVIPEAAQLFSSPPNPNPFVCAHWSR